MTTKHTPGPWKISDYPDMTDGSGPRVEILPTDKTRCFTTTHSYRLVGIAVIEKSNNPDEDLRNARLISAAPELLEGLKTVIPWLAKAIADDVFSDCVSPATAQKAIEMARAAIAKAEGEL